MESIKELEDSLFQKLEHNPVDFNTLNKLGYIYLHSNNLLKSEEFYLKSIYIEPKQFEPYVSLGLLCTITLRLGRALYYLLKAKEQNPDSAELTKSIEEINMAILNKESKLTNDEINKLVHQANSKLENDDFEEAVDLYLRLNCINPDSDAIVLNLILSLLKKGDYSLANSYSTELISKNSNNAMAYYYAGVSSNFLDNIEDAKKYVQKSLELKPSLADIITKGKSGHYQKNYDEEVLDKCPICGSSDTTVVNVINQSINSFNFNIINPIRIWSRCNKTGLIFSSTRPTKNSLKKYSYELFFNSREIFESDVERTNLETNSYNNRINCIERFVKKGKCLDINSDFGIFISTISSRGWDTLGLEENILKYERLKNEFDLNVLNNNIFDFETKDKFSLVTIWESIEKFPEFDKVFDKVHEILEVDGIFALSFHGYETYVSKTLRKSYPTWYYPDYLYFFGIDYLKNLLTEKKFEIVDIQITGRKYMSNVEMYCKKIS